MTEFTRLVDIVATLRSPGGCPWDREQTIDSLKPYILEETYEVLEAIDRHYHAGLCEELRAFAKRHGGVYVRARNDARVEDVVRRIVERAID